MESHLRSLEAGQRMGTPTTFSCVSKALSRKRSGSRRHLSRAGRLGRGESSERVVASKLSESLSEVGEKKKHLRKTGAGRAGTDLGVHSSLLVYSTSP